MERVEPLQLQVEKQQELVEQLLAVVYERVGSPQTLNLCHPDEHVAVGFGLQNA